MDLEFDCCEGARNQTVLFKTSQVFKKAEPSFSPLKTANHLLDSIIVFPYLIYLKFIVFHYLQQSIT